MSENGKIKKRLSRFVWFLLGASSVIFANYLVKPTVAISPITMLCPPYDRGEGQPKFVEVDMPRHVKAELAREFVKKGVTFAYVGEFYLPPMEGDPDMSSSAIWNVAADLVRERTGRDYWFSGLAGRKECDDLRAILAGGDLPEHMLKADPR